MTGCKCFGTGIIVRNLAAIISSAGNFTKYLRILERISLVLVNLSMNSIHAGLLDPK